MLLAWSPVRRSGPAAVRCRIIECSVFRVRCWVTLATLRWGISFVFEREKECTGQSAYYRESEEKRVRQRTETDTETETETETETATDRESDLIVGACIGSGWVVLLLKAYTCVSGA